MNIAKALRQFARTSNGSVTVEFIAILPLLLVTLVFSFEFGYALWTYDVMTRDVRTAVRYLARSSPLDTATATTMATMGLPSALVSSASVSLYCTACSNPPVLTFVSGSSYRQSGEVVQVQASVPLTLPLLGYLNSAVAYGAKATGKTVPAAVPTTYTLVVWDQARHNDVGD